MDISTIPALRIPTLKLPGIDATTATPTEATSTSGTALNGFGKALMNAIEGLNQVQGEAEDKSVALASGEPVDIHDVVLSRETASLDLQLALQVRNKLVEAYQDVMRM